ncbi:hypothetical protein PVK06_035362 [Gossypium arboreum]|uniref:Uncharacterized protein n=1 Tax=Gossypium arboreum TaxID=29729 RepID=A0ABR0NH34_GOSAR|nr:hypothetical protein PVK06_035362 [Gossypium arboreum]
MEIKCNKYKKIGHNKRSCKRKVGQNLPVTRNKVVHNQVFVPTHQEATPTYQQAAPRQKLPFKRKPAGEPTTIRWIPSIQVSWMPST